jgi:signal transduction histidine kinase
VLALEHQYQTPGPARNYDGSMPLRSRLGAIALGWLAYALFFGTQAWLAIVSSGRDARWTNIVGWWLLCAAIWACFTPVALALARRLPLGRRARNYALHLGAACAISAAALLIFALLARTPRVGYLFVAEFHVGILVYFAIVVISSIIDHRVAGAELERMLQQARLEALRMQLQPHFLFNALGSIAILIDEEPETARAMVVRLSDLLRATLDTGRRDEVPLRDELVIVERYLDIERIRFRDRLTVEVTADPASLDCRVPSFLLQPLVENAIRHGIAARAGAGRIDINARLHFDAERLSVTVSDDGAGLSDASRDGIGLATVRARLEQMFPSAHTMSLRNRAGRGCEVEIAIPAKRAAA